MNRTWNNRYVFLIAVVSFICLLLPVVTDAGVQYEITGKKTISWTKYKVEWAKFADKNGKTIPYILILPNKNNPKKIPCVIELHGITGSKWEWTDIGGFTKGGDLTEKLLEKGYAVFAIDHPMHGDRAEKVYGSFDEHFSAIRNRWDDFYIEAVGDIYESVGFIRSRPEIDGERLALVGYSLGGLFSMEIGTKLPEGIKTVVTCVPPVIEDRDNLSKKIARMIHVPSLLMIIAKEDVWSKVEKSREVFALIPVDDKKLLEYDGGHSLPAAYTDEVLQWIIKQAR
jgi:dienelactone hydrolase